MVSACCVKVHPTLGRVPCFEAFRPRWQGGPYASFMNTTRSLQCYKGPIDAVTISLPHTRRSGTVGWSQHFTQSIGDHQHVGSRALCPILGQRKCGIPTRMKLDDSARPAESVDSARSTNLNARENLPAAHFDRALLTPKGQPASRRFDGCTMTTRPGSAAGTTTPRPWQRP